MVLSFYQRKVIEDEREREIVEERERAAEALAEITGWKLDLFCTATRAFPSPRESLSPWVKRAGKNSARGLTLIVISARLSVNLSVTRL